MIVGVDIDNVIADTEKEVRRVMFEDRGIKLARDDFRDYAPEKLDRFSKEDLDYILGRFRDGNIFLDVEAIDGARETLDRLMGRHRVVLVTSRPPLVEDFTRRWLKKNEIPYHELHFTPQSKLNGIAYDLFIEDQDNFAREIADSGTYVLLYDAPWNRHFTHENCERVLSWDDIRKFCFPPCALGH